MGLGQVPPCLLSGHLLALIDRVLLGDGLVILLIGERVELSASLELQLLLSALL
jgi:hypothetical protein